MHNRIVFICGRKGSGKTTLAARLARRLYAAGRRVLVVAPMGGFSLPGVPVIRENDYRKFENLRGRSALVLPDNDDLARAAFLFAWSIQENLPGANSAGSMLWLIVDEIDLYFSGRDPDPTLQKIVRYGRHRGISLVGISQRPANVNNDLLAQADDRVVFRTTEPNDLDYLRRFTGLDPLQAQSLEPFKYLTL